MTEEEELSETLIGGEDRWKKTYTRKSKKKLLIVIGVCLILTLVIIVVVVTTKGKGSKNRKPTSQRLTALEFTKAAVATDTVDCSKIGRDILKKKGSAVDAAVASLFCQGLLNMHGNGLGGGGYLNFYNRTQKKAYIYDFREVAPLSATEDMYVNKTGASQRGGLSIAVPGNVKGLHHVWKKHGRLLWGELIDPTIKLAEDGFVISTALGSTIGFVEKNDKSKKVNVTGLSELFKKKDGTFHKPGDTIKNVKLAETLKKIKANPDVFYTGSLAEEIVKDVNEAGGNFSIDDLTNYKVVEREPVETTIKEMKVFSMPPPGSGALVEMIMNILEGYNMSRDNIKDDESILATTHKIIEAFKFAYARRPLLGDPKFVNVTETIEAMLNKTFAEELRLKIKSTPYPNETYYGGFYSQDQNPYGTTHLSVFSEDGDAVGATDTINYRFGSGIRSTRNGIIYNNEMDDFSTPGLNNLWGYRPSKANFIKPGKRPLSSMSPTIITNKDGDVVMIAGASGGSRIITATSLTLIRKLYLDEDLGRAVSDARVHSQLQPYDVTIAKPSKRTISDKLKKGLERLGHKVEESKYFSVVQAIYSDNKNNKIYAMSDPRKVGVPAGY